MIVILILTLIRILSISISISSSIQHVALPMPSLLSFMVIITISIILHNMSLSQCRRIAQQREVGGSLQGSADGQDLL